MLTIFSIILPIFLLMGLGFLAVKTQIVKPDTLPGIGGLVLYFILPATIFSAISRIHFSEVIELHFLLVYSLASLFTLATGLAINHWILKKDLTSGAIKGLGMALPNSIFIGFSILQLSLPDIATIAFVLALITENLLILPIVLILLEYSAGRQQAGSGRNIWKVIGLRIVKNPLMVALAAGVIASLTELQLPKPIDQTLDLLTRASAALALLYVGATLASNSFRGNTDGLSLVVFGKLILHPAMAALFVWLLPGFDPTLQQSVIIITAVPMLAIYPLVGDQFGYRTFCANTLLVTTAMAFFTLASVLWLVGVG